MYPLGYNPEKLVDVIWKGTKAMYLNDGSTSNKNIFWQVFVNEYGKEKLVDKDYVDEFYTNEFKQVKENCKDNPLAKEIVKFCKDNDLITILSTNPIFPKDGTLTRMSFVNLKEDDFDYITSYENSSFCKPNPNYFKDLLNKFDLLPEEVILFGNNTYEDGECALACGIKCYMVGDFIINPPKSTHSFEHLKMEEVIPTIIKELNK